MNQSHSQINSLLIIVALLAVIGGLSIVIVTSPKSWELGPAAWLQGPPPTLTPVPASATPTPTETETPTVMPSATFTAPPTSTAPQPTEAATDAPTLAISTTVEATGTPVPPTPVPAVTSNTLPEDVFGLAVVTLQSGATSGRLRDAPNGDTVLAAVPNGTNVQVLFGRVEAEGNMWVEVRLETGTVGWMAEFLLRYTVRRP